MGNAPSTQSRLLARLRDRRDREAWDQFEEVYRPLVVGFARRKGLQSADADDVWQDVLTAVSRRIEGFQYDPSGSFAGWLLAIALNKIRDLARRAAREIPGTGRSSIQEILEEQPAPEEAERFERDYYRRRLEWAAERVRGRFEGRTFQAFWNVLVEGLDRNEVAARLGMSPNALRIAIHRVWLAVKDVSR